MAIELVLAAVAGVAAGIATGLAPGIHPNTITAIILSNSALFAGIAPAATAAFVVAMAVSNAVSAFLPSIFLGAPDAEESLSVLPGHRLLLEGRGNEAVALTVAGSVVGVVASVLFLPVGVVILPRLYQTLQIILPAVLTLILAIMVWTEPKKRRLPALAVVVMSGVLGLIVLNNGVGLAEPLFPLLSGLFATSSLLLSLHTNPTPPPQQQTVPPIPTTTIRAGVGSGCCAGMLVGLLPGVGAAQATVLVQQFQQNNAQERFLVAIGAISVSTTFFSLLSLSLISKARSGAAIAVQQLLPSFGLPELLLTVFAGLFGVGLAAVATLRLSRACARCLAAANYQLLSVFILVVLVILTVVLSGVVGLVVLVVATAVGVIPQTVGVKRSHCMGVILVPVLWWLVV